MMSKNHVGQEQIKEYKKMRKQVYRNIRVNIMLTPKEKEMLDAIITANNETSISEFLRDHIKNTYARLK